MIQACNDYVYVERYEAPGITDSGLIIPNNAKPLLKKGRVLSVGPGRRCENTKERMGMNINPGDEIVWVQQGVEKVFVDGKPHIFVEEKYILAVIENG